ncbi:zinc ribbon domain-containing protein [Actinoallomurus iriomotensis]|uniref:zinc ribbon domain-containing protein n=1 Tax=Actinoallomurus iriomotensis TaxID=478107 RepID=UPI003D7F2CF2
MFSCSSCGAVLSRDVNAARNIAAYAATASVEGAVASGAGETLNARGAPVGPIRRRSPP